MTTKPRSSRRKFLATLGVGGAAAAAVALTQHGGQPGPTSDKTAETQGKGYKLTEHVRNYYRTAKV
jgi:nitrous oxide reductase